MRVKSALIRGYVITHVVPLALVALAGAYVIGGQWLLEPHLADWWFQTDACPQDPNLHCGQPAPIGLLMVAPLAAVVSVMVWRMDRDE